MIAIIDTTEQTGLSQLQANCVVSLTKGTVLLIDLSVVDDSLGPSSSFLTVPILFAMTLNFLPLKEWNIFLYPVIMGSVI